MSAFQLSPTHHRDTRNSGSVAHGVGETHTVPSMTVSNLGDRSFTGSQAVYKAETMRSPAVSAPKSPVMAQRSPVAVRKAQAEAREAASMSQTRAVNRQRPAGVAFGQRPATLHNGVRSQSPSVRRRNTGEVPKELRTGRTPQDMTHAPSPRARMGTRNPRSFSSEEAKVTLRERRLSSSVSKARIASQSASGMYGCQSPAPEASPAAPMTFVGSSASKAYTTARDEPVPATLTEDGLVLEDVGEGEAAPVPASEAGDMGAMSLADMHMEGEGEAEAEAEPEPVAAPRSIRPETMPSRSSMNSALFHQPADPIRDPSGGKQQRSRSPHLSRPLSLSAYRHRASGVRHTMQPSSQPMPGAQPRQKKDSRGAPAPAAAPSSPYAAPAPAASMRDPASSGRVASASAYVPPAPAAAQREPGQARSSAPSATATAYAAPAASPAPTASVSYAEPAPAAPQRDPASSGRNDSRSSANPNMNRTQPLTHTAVAHTRPQSYPQATPDQGQGQGMTVPVSMPAAALMQPVPASQLVEVGVRHRDTDKPQPKSRRR
ncbi:hypothetical protein KIPB_002744 [Kipferlia bialata]|uniref:Uncharacterized protein n=1 Tax=Kipferlia bialata TaxID=797122 RepID=A0A9K3GGM2_9EUKA|nr:hypothetical protein KIPB_002744 [Kipferlia bialata]|eukprot:g2744.t1